MFGLNFERPHRFLLFVGIPADKLAKLQKQMEGSSPSEIARAALARGASPSQLADLARAMGATPEEFAQIQQAIEEKMAGTLGNGLGGGGGAGNKGESGTHQNNWPF